MNRPSRPFISGASGPEPSRALAAQVDAVVIKTTRVTGFVLTELAGEATHIVSFPVIFAERPSMSFGGELDDNEFVVERKLPTVSVVVIRWVKAMTDRVGGGINAPGWYVGAELAIVTTGKPSQKLWVHWQAEGKAIRAPLGSAGDLDEAL